MPPSDPHRFELIYSSEKWRDVDDLQPLIERAAHLACEHANKEFGRQSRYEVSINLSTDADVHKLNQQYRGKAAPTNVLSFPFEDDFPDLSPDRFPGPSPLGDIILAFETVAREAATLNIPLRHHIAHLVVHGVLHLFGYDHVELSEAEKMEELERQILSSLKIPSPYRDA